MSKITKKIPVEVQNRSGFNCSHSSTFSATCGTLTPIMVDHVMPNTTINLDVSCEVNLPPAISDFYGSIEARMEFFFVPYRVIWAGWKYFFVQPPQGGAVNIPSNQPEYIRIDRVPGFVNPATNQITPGSLMDMLGYKMINSPRVDRSMPNILPLVAYHKIYDDFYRDSRLTAPIFRPPHVAADNSSWKCLPWLLAYGAAGTRYTFDPTIDLFNLHQRCWDKDYFTNATYTPQSGDEASLELSLEVTGEVDDTGEVSADGTTSFSMSQLYVMNSLQRFATINNIAGMRQADQQYARFGCYPSDSALDRPLYLGQKRFSVYKRSVYQQNSSTSTTGNPFGGLLGNKTSALSGYGEGFMGKFHAKDAGLIFVMFSLVPKATYSTGVRRYLSYDSLSDFPEPLLQGVGDQPIYQFEVAGFNTSDGNLFNKDKVFGYTQRYAEAKFMQDEVHGLLRDGSDLSMFQLQRSFDSDQDLGTSFLEIPIDYLDQITTADASVSKYGCWCNCFFNYKKVQPLAAYSLPTLGDPKDTHTVIVDNGGRRL